MATVLKVLLQQRHLQTVSAFNREYDRLALTIDPDLVGEGPKKAQFYRWLSGNVSGLPYPHHCRILEAMFPGRTVTELLAEQRQPGREIDRNHMVELPAPQAPKYADVEAIFVNRAQFIELMPPRDLFKEAKRIDMSGLSLNLLCQQHSDADTLSLLASGTQIRCLFLGPDGIGIRHREQEEGYAPGVLSNLTSLNMNVLARVQAQLAPDAQGSLTIRTYDEPVRFNITIIDNEQCIVQLYLPRARGVESPTFVARRSLDTGIFTIFSQVFETMWTNAKEAPPL